MKTMWSRINVIKHNKHKVHSLKNINYNTIRDHNLPVGCI